MDLKKHLFALLFLLVAFSAIATILSSENPMTTPPVAIEDWGVSEENGSVVVEVLKNDSDAEDMDLGPCNVTIIDGPFNGTVAFGSTPFDTCRVRYSPNQDFLGLDTFTYQICDSDANCSTANVYVETVYDLPNMLLRDDNGITLEDTPVNILILNNDYVWQTNFDISTLEVTSPAANGTVAIIPFGTSATIDYTPDPNFNGSDSFTYRICISSSYCQSANVFISVTPGNDPPQANPDFAVTEEDTQVAIDVVSNDSDPEEGSLNPCNVSIVGQPLNGALTIGGAPTCTVYYIPNSGFIGVDSLLYSVCDSEGLCDDALVVITVEVPTNDPPVAADDAYGFQEDTPITLDILANDSDEDGSIDPSTLVIISQPTDGTLVVNSDGTVTYTPDLGFVGNDQFSYQVCDDGSPLPQECDEATVFLSGICTPPTVTTLSTVEHCGQEDGSLDVTVTGGQSPYTYTWSNGATQSVLSGLAAGTYNLTVIDASGCIGVGAEVILNQNVSISTSSVASDCAQSTGSATVTILSGANNPTYEWSNGETTATITGLAPAWYSVTVNDTEFACNKHQNILVEEDYSCRVIINGYLINDEVNEDCLDDTTSVPLPYRLVELKDGATTVDMTYTNSQGFYEFVANSNTYTVEFQTVQVDTMLCPATNSATVVATTDGQTYTQDFYTSTRYIRDLTVYLNKGTARPGFTVYQSLTVCNNGIIQEDGTVSVVHDPSLLNFIQTTTGSTYDAANNKASWDFTDLQAGTCKTYSFRLTLDATTPIGTVLDYTSTVTLPPNDLTPDNNVLECNQTVTGSYDPNDKQNFSAEDSFGGDIDPDIETYHYQIRFQNTGTDTAFTVVVRDVIEPNLDIRSFTPVASSHDYTLDVENNNELVFFFQDIMLPDSFVNEPASNGFISFTLDRLPDLPLGTEISNEANIYFDFNQPVLTNTVVNTLADPDGIKPSITSNFDLGIFPNPTSSEKVFIDLKLESAAAVSLNLLDVKGREVLVVTPDELLTSGKHIFDMNTKGLTPGIYFLQLVSDSGVLTKKLVKF